MEGKLNTKTLSLISVSIVGLLYVLRQTAISQEIKMIFEIFIGICISFEFYYFLKQRNSIEVNFFKYSNVQLFFISIFLVAPLFSDFKSVSILLFKMLFSFILLSIYSNIEERKKLINALSSSMLLSLFAVVLLANSGVISSDKFQTEFWYKNFSSFINPNIPGYFIFAILLGYFITENRNGIILSVAMWLLMLGLHTYSRTFSIGIFFIFVYVLVSVKIRTYLSRAVNILGLFILILNILFILSVLLNFDFIHQIATSKLNSLLSKRLSIIAYDSFFIDRWSYNLELHAFDGIHYELLFTLGLLAPIIFISGVLKFFKSKFNTEFDNRWSFAVGLLLLVGQLEGLFAKFGLPVIILLSIIAGPTFILNRDIPQNYFYDKSYFIFLKKNVKYFFLYLFFGIALALVCINSSEKYYRTSAQIQFPDLKSIPLEYYLLNASDRIDGNVDAGNNNLNSDKYNVLYGDVLDGKISLGDLEKERIRQIREIIIEAQKKKMCFDLQDKQAGPIYIYTRYRAADYHLLGLSATGKSLEMSKACLEQVKSYFVDAIERTRSKNQVNFPDLERGTDTEVSAVKTEMIRPNNRLFILLGLYFGLLLFGVQFIFKSHTGTKDVARSR